MCGHGMDSSCSWLGQVAVTCESGSENSGTIKCWEFFI